LVLEKQVHLAVAVEVWWLVLGRCHYKGVGRKASALWAGIAVVVLGVAVAAIGLKVHGWTGAVTGAVLAAVGTVIAGFVPWFLDRAERWRAARRRARLALVPMLGPQLEDSQPGPAFLLRPERAVVRFAGRAAELEELRAWCGPGAPQSVRALVGAGGVGKTRLAWELATGFKAPRRGRRRPDANCGAWLVKADKEDDAVQAARGVAKGLVLLVVDYAETRTGLERLLTEALADPGPLRVLLLARSLGEWWDRLVSESDHEVSQLLRQAPQVRLGAAVARAESDAELAAAAVPYLAAELKLPAPRVEFQLPPERVPVLVLHAAALVAVLRSAPDSAPQQVVVREEGVLEELLTHEERYWRRTAKASGLPDDGEILKPVVAVAALLGAATQDEAAQLIRRIPRLAGASDEERRRWAQWLYDLYPPDPDGRLGSVQPGLLAETHATIQLSNHPDLARACLQDLSADQAGHALTVLARAQAHHSDARQIIATALRADLANLAIPAAQVAVQTWAGLGDLLADALRDAPALLEALIGIAAALPYPSVILAQAHLSVTSRVLKSLPPESMPLTWTEYVQRVAVMLVDQGRLADARPFAEEAVNLFRELAAASPDEYRPGLAASLSNLSILLSRLGLAGEALPPMEEAATLYRDLAAASLDPYRPDLAKSLDNLGVMRSGLGSTADARTVSEEAVTIYRDLAAARPGQYHDGLARSLSNLSNRLRELGQDTAARTAAQEAFAIRRALAAADPDRYRPDLAASLDNLGVLLREAHQAAGALPSAEAAVSLYRDLADAIPGRYGPDLARSLNNLGVCLDALDRADEAVAVTEAAIALFRVAVAANPGGNRPGLADALDNLGRLHGKVGRPADALTAIEEAVAIRGDLAAANPDRYRPDLANSMNNLAVAFSILNRPAEALTAIEEAVAIRRELAAASPDRYRPGLADALVTLGLLLVDVGRRAESDTAIEEAFAIRRDLNVAKLERIVQEIPDMIKLADKLRALDKDPEGVRAETLAEPDASSHAALDGEDAAADGIDQGGVVGFGPVGVEAGEPGQGDVEAAGVADDHGSATGPGVALGQQVAEDGGVAGLGPRVDGLHGHAGDHRMSSGGVMPGAT
jgi:tetratricopeptide (TPR) repeat protein